MAKVTVSFELEGTNAELIAQFAKLLQEPVAVAEPIKVKKVKRILTEAEKKVIRDRFAAGRAKAALARGEVAPANPVIAVAPAKSVAKPKSSATGLPIPKTGHKVGAKPAAE